MNRIPAVTLHCLIIIFTAPHVPALVGPYCVLGVPERFGHSSTYQGMYSLSKSIQRPYKPDGNTLTGLLLLFPQLPNFRYRFLDNTYAIQNLDMAEHLFDWQ